MAATLTDVARHAGVSLATASRAFGDPQRLASTTRQRVLDAAHELGYDAPVSAASATRTIGVIVPDVSNPVYAQHLKAINAQTWHGRHRTVLFNTDENPHREREQIAEARKLDGLLLCSPRLPQEELIEALGHAPVVIVNRRIAATSCVMMDASHGLRQAIAHLSALGHRHIAYAAGPRQSSADVLRADIITAACAELGIQITLLSHNAASIQGGRAAAATAVASGATAVVAYNDLVALGMHAGLTALGLRCPQDISIVGIDDIEISSAVQPGITTVHLAIERAGALAVDLLLQQLSGKAGPQEISLDSQLIARGSTARPAS